MTEKKGLLKENYDLAPHILFLHEEMKIHSCLLSDVDWIIKNFLLLFCVFVVVVCYFYYFLPYL